MDATLIPSKKYLAQIDEAADFLRSRLGEVPACAVILGSGLGEHFRRAHFQDSTIPYQEIPNWGRAAVTGHPGVFARVRREDGRALLLLQGRLHFYEGYGVQQVAFPVRVLARLGVKSLVLTNAAGALHDGLGIGDLVQMTDHLNFTGVDALRGENLDALGVRFPSMFRLYQNSLAEMLARQAEQANLALKKGVYVGISGPSYETGAEIEAYRRLGGDMIGMSTVLEAVAARHAGLQVAGLSVITNHSDQSRAPLTHELVLQNAKVADERLARWLDGLWQTESA